VLYFQLSRKKGDATQIAARPGKTGDQSGLEEMAAGRDDGNSVGRGVGSARFLQPRGVDEVGMSPNQLPGQVRQLLGLAHARLEH
jgi:hypothetical protein